MYTLYKRLIEEVHVSQNAMKTENVNVTLMMRQINQKISRQKIDMSPKKKNKLKHKIDKKCCKNWFVYHTFSFIRNKLSGFSLEVS